MTREEVFAEARSWLGCPYVHQGRSRSGVDCAGLPIVVARALGIVTPDFDVNGYARAPDGKSLVALCELFMTRVPLAEFQAGDVLVLKWERDPQHLGIVAPYKHGGLSLIHALGKSDGKGRVVEHRIDPDTRRRAVAAFVMPGVA